MDKFSSTIPHQMRLLFSSIMLPLPMGLHSPRTKIILWYVKLGSKSISSWSFPLFPLGQLIESLVTCRCILHNNAIVLFLSLQITKKINYRSKVNKILHDNYVSRLIINYDHLVIF